MAKKQTSGNLALEQQRVIVIPAHDEIIARKLRVAAYARVSSSSEDQLNSYRVQNQYYSELISGNPDWEMVDIYADEGITGTSVEKREDFQRMMCDCRKGKIDRILVKKHFPIRQKHKGLPCDGSGTEGTWRQCSVRGTGHRHGKSVQRDGDGSHGIAGAERQRVDFRQCQMGCPETNEGWHIHSFLPSIRL